MPPCEIALALSMLGLSVSRELTFVQDAMMRVGTLVHTILTEWLGRTGILWGHWDCPACGATKRYLTNSNECEECGNECTYTELRFFHKGLGVHMDGFLGVDEPQILAEFKVIGSERQELFVESGLPETYVAQVKAYHHVIARKTSIRIDPVVPVALFSRDTISDVVVIPVDCADAAGAFEEFEAHYKAVKRAVYSKDFREVAGLEKVCPDDRPCPYEVICGSPKLVTTLKDLKSQGVISWPLRK